MARPRARTCWRPRCVAGVRRYRRGLGEPHRQGDRRDLGRGEVPVRRHRRVLGRGPAPHRRTTRRTPVQTCARRPLHDGLRRSSTPFRRADRPRFAGDRDAARRCPARRRARAALPADRRPSCSPGVAAGSTLPEALPTSTSTRNESARSPRSSRARCAASSPNDSWAVTPTSTWRARADQRDRHLPGANRTRKRPTRKGLRDGRTRRQSRDRHRNQPAASAWVSHTSCCGPAQP